MDRFDELNRPSIVKVAEALRDLALKTEAKTGKPIIYETAWDAGNLIGYDTQMVRLGLRLANTAQFLDDNDWGFVLPGSGRSGAVYGYTLLYDRSLAASQEARDQLEYWARRDLDHSDGEAAHWERLALGHGRKTSLGKSCHQIARIQGGVSASLQAIIKAMP
jgi:hypothetical protein